MDGAVAGNEVYGIDMVVDFGCCLRASYGRPELPSEVGYEEVPAEVLHGLLN